jgi:carotenoid cleavage dioxygenase-like enzyme
MGHFLWDGPYVTTLDVDPGGRYLYYVCGAHGGSQRDGTPIVQFDVRTGKKKVLAFLHPFYKEKYGYVPLGTFGSAVSEDGSKLYVTWNGNRGGADSRGRVGFDTCALTVVHIPESERRP